MDNKFDKAKYVRREVRRTRFITAHVVTGGMNAECRVDNISRDGARVFTELAGVLPAKFEMTFSNDLKRKCNVVWRNAKMMGVRFV